MPSETEYASVFAAHFATGKIRPSSFQVVRDANDETLLLDGTFSQPTDASIRIIPMERLKSGGRRRAYNSASSSSSNVPVKWNGDVHFSPQLRYPSHHTASTDGVVVCFEAMAREGVLVALSSDNRYVMGQTWEICFGAAGNTQSTISRRQPRRQPAAEATSRPCRVCLPTSYQSFWICRSNDKVYAGIGKVPGQQCMVVLQDEGMIPVPKAATTNETDKETSEPRADDEENEAEATTKEGEGADDKTEETGQDGESKPSPPVEVEPVAIRFVGFGNAGTGDRQAPVPLKVRNIVVTTVPEDLATTLSNLSDTDIEQTIQSLQNDDALMDDETRALMAEYEAECQKARARAAKFGVEYKEPPADAFLPWSQARKMRANPKAGFVTGIDLSSEQEKAKIEARKQRFGAALGEMAATTESSEQTDTVGTMDGPLQGDRSWQSELLEATHAWDNEKLVKPLRTDPPPELWKIPPAEDEDPSSNEFAMDTEKPTFVPEKVHIFSIDWAAFKQIRTQDIMAHFSIYGPSYVEWLGDLSCNVLFEDKFSAARALENLSKEIPTPPPQAPTADTPIVVAGDAESGVPPLSATGEGPLEVPTDTPPRSDLGAMGWRFGNKMLRKISNDRYGRRGTTARLLFRLATSIDVLHDRPSTWPKPPPGFTTKRVLGPGSDYSRRGRDQGQPKRRRGSDNDRDGGNRKPWNPMSGEEPPLLSGGLKSGRPGFSLEEMEAERAKKRAKTSGGPKDDDAAG